MKVVKVVLGVLLLAAGACAPEETAMQDGASMRWPTLDGDPPLIIAHRGASGYLPEHTLEAYALAIEQGADVIEPDLVFTKDSVLVARHDRYLSTTTDVAAHPEFADRKKPNADPNDAPREDWWVEDFTLAEIKTLRAVQPFPGRSTEYDGLYEVPTFEEVKALVSQSAAEAGRPVGVYPETKHPGYFASIGMDFEEPLLAALKDFAAGPVFIQSFEPEILKRLKSKTDAKLVQLVYEATPGAGPNIPLAEIAEYADGVGPAKDLLLTTSGDFSALIENAHALGLVVHPWTFRNDQPNGNIKLLQRFTFSLDGDEERVKNEISGPSATMEGAPPIIEYRMFYFSGIDGLFTDFPDTAVLYRGMIGTEEFGEH